MKQDGTWAPSTVLRLNLVNVTDGSKLVQALFKDDYRGQEFGIRDYLWSLYYLQFGWSFAITVSSPAEAPMIHSAESTGGGPDLTAWTGILTVVQTMKFYELNFPDKLTAEDGPQNLEEWMDLFMTDGAADAPGVKAMFDSLHEKFVAQTGDAASRTYFTRRFGRFRTAISVNKATKAATRKQYAADTRPGSYRFQNDLDILR